MQSKIHLTTTARLKNNFVSYGGRIFFLRQRRRFIIDEILTKELKQWRERQIQNEKIFGLVRTWIFYAI